MMLSNISPYNILYPIENTLDRISTTSSIYNANGHDFSIWSFLKLELCTTVCQNERQINLECR